MATPKVDDRIQFMRERIRSSVHELAGRDADSYGIELAAMLHLVARVYEAVNPVEKDGEISRSRWGILMRLMGEERQGRVEGVTPTYLSRCQNVSKNTISALLRGLEEQGLVTRQLDPIDHRLFRIQLTDAGRRIILDSAPRHVAYLNRLASELTLEERDRLMDLLARLFHSVVQHTGLSEADLEALRREKYAEPERRA